MRLAVAAFIALSACTEATAPSRPCEPEYAAVGKANAAFRRATEWYTQAVEKDALSHESNEAWKAVDAAASQQGAARDALAACLNRAEAP